MKPALNRFVIADTSKCTECRSCEVACAASHRDINTNYTVGNMDTPIVPRLFLVENQGVSGPIQCRQCEDAPCEKHCPTNAIKYDGENITINQKYCIGCKSCLLACPVGAIDFFPRYNNIVQNGTINRKLALIAYRCDMCKNAGGEPNCVKVCSSGALRVENPEIDIVAKHIKTALALALL
jgi:electron transport protein HydN